MRISPKEIDKLILHNAGVLAQKRYARGLRLNYPETVALLATQLLEFIRDGETVADLMDKGKKILGLKDVMPGVEKMLHEVQVEGTFPDGTKLVTVHQPVCREKGDPDLALYGSGLSVAGSSDQNSTSDYSNYPGKYFLHQEDIELNVQRSTVTIEVINMGDRPVQVGSHYPFFETNAGLKFDREKAYGYRLDIPSGTAVRFEPGETKVVQLVEFAGEKIIYGGNNLINGSLMENKAKAIDAVREQNFLNI